MTVTGAHKSSVLRFDFYSESILAEEEYLNKREQRGRRTSRPHCGVFASISVVIIR